MTPRNTKQIIISLAYIVIFSLIAFWFYTVFLKAPETCFDGIQNQNEAAIDCGGVCGACQEKPAVLDMQVLETSLIPGGAGETDVLVKIYNPNDRYGASRFAYTMTLKDSQGNVVVTKTGESFILPRETKYIVRTNIATGSSAMSAEVTMSDIDWHLFSGYREKPALNVYAKHYGPVTTGVGFGQADGTLSNESGFDFQSLTVKVVLRDASDRPLAVNMTEMRTVTAGERRDFRLIWPTYFPGNVEKIEVETEADVYHADNFIRQYLPGGAFQQL